MNVKITGDGTVTGTKLFTADGRDLTELQHITSVTFSHGAGGMPRVLIEMALPLIDVEGRIVRANWQGRSVKRIEFEDGQVLDFSGDAS